MENKNIVGNITFSNNLNNELDAKIDKNSVNELNNRINELTIEMNILKNKNRYINHKYEALKTLLFNFKDTLEDIVANELIVPEANCSCHISPPCSDCVENSVIRENIKKIKHFIKFVEIINRD